MAELKIPIVLTCDETTARFCVDMLNIFLADHRKTHDVIISLKDPDGEYGYCQIRLEERTRIVEAEK